MPENLGDIVSTVLAVVAFLGLAFVYLRGSADKGTIESQDRLIKAQGAELLDLTRRLDNAERRVATVEAENVVLHDAVSHVEEIVRLQETLDAHHQDTIVALREIKRAVEGTAA